MLIVVVLGGVQRVEFVAPAHQQHRVDGLVAGEGRLSDSWDGEIARVALGERIGNFIGSAVSWDHGCGAREEGEDVAAAFICRPPMGTPKPRGETASRSQSSYLSTKYRSGDGQVTPALPPSTTEQLGREVVYPTRLRSIAN